MGYQDVSAVLMKNGQLIAAIEEERVIREKHARGRLSERSIDEVLRIAGITFDQVDVVATHGATWGEPFLDSLRAYLKSQFGHVPHIERHHHHECHAASAYYASGFDRALTITADGSGDGSSMRIYDCEGKKMTLLTEFKRPNSLGLFYSVITQYCGFVRDSDEYKLMGLAPYGNANRFNLDGVLSVKNGEFRLNQTIFKRLIPGEPQPTKQEPAYNDEILTVFENIKPKLKSSEISQNYMDIAASAQKKLEEVLVEIAGHWMGVTGNTNLCLAGGVALNCAANMKMAEMIRPSRLFVQPASSDAGISLGAAYLSCLGRGHNLEKMSSVALGRSFSEEEIIQQLNLFQLAYTRVDPARKAAELVAQGKVIGWFQGKEEFGPRALGYRSILASAKGLEMKSTINSKIKFRESFRPFCPSVLEEDLHEHFITPLKELPFMTINARVVEAEKFPSITHVDGTARVQSVSAAENPLYHSLLVHLKSITGSGVCVNTSFNRSNEPMAGTPRDAISIFFGSGLDALVMGPFLIQKS